ncbi:MAG: hypothetical protein ACLQVJ_12125 [Syntrophobacteraceae bacterium]
MEYAKSEDDIFRRLAVFGVMSLALGEEGMSLVWGALPAWSQENIAIEYGQKTALRPRPGASCGGSGSHE